MIDVMDRRTGATFDVDRDVIDRCPNEEWADFAEELATICGFVTAAGGWWRETNTLASHWRVECVGPRADVEAIAELVDAMNTKWGAA